MKRIIYLILFIMIGLPVYAQFNNMSCFKIAASGNQRHSFNSSTFARDTTINLDIHQPIYGLTVSGESQLLNDKSYVRITLKDEEDHEYLVYENYTLLSDDLIAGFNGIGMETVLLKGVTPRSLNFRIENASLRLDGIQYATSYSQNYSLRSAEIRAEQTAEMVDKLNRHLKERKMTWRAGITSVAGMTYEEKKQMYGDDVPYMGGWEYYRGGIFVMPGFEPDALTARNSSPYVKEFDWRNRHGKNWLTSVKKQYGNTCWAFASIGLVEACTNLYYNRLLNYDLSEQELVSCAAGSGYDPIQSGYYVTSALYYTKKSGIVEESCFPMTANARDVCGNKCKNPGEIIKIDGYRSIDPISEDQMREYVLKSPVCQDIFFNKNKWGHSVVLAGYKNIQEGDSIQIYMPNQNTWEHIEQGNPLIGTTAWLIKNSYGEKWGDNGYGYVVMNQTSSLRACTISGRISSLIYKDSDIICEDNDGDGYYFWGIGTKPASLPSWVPDEPDGDDANANLGPMNSYGHLKDLNPDLLSPQRINTPTIWSSDNYIHSHLLIQNGGQLTVLSNISMHKDANIVVASGGTLIVDGGKINRANVVVKSGGCLVIRNGGILQKESTDEFISEVGAILDISYGSIQ